MSDSIMIGIPQTRSCAANLVVETRAEGEGSAPSRTITGYAIRFNEWSKPFWGEWVEMIDPHAFDTCDMSDVVMCTDHSRACTDVLARKRGDDGTLSISIDEQGVRFSFEAPNTSVGNDLLELVRRGDVSECSFCFIAEKDQWQWKNVHNSLEYDQRTILQIRKLCDISLVVSPQYNNTSVEAERSAYTSMRQTQGGANNIELVKERDYLNNEEQTF